MDVQEFDLPEKLEKPSKEWRKEIREVHEKHEAVRAAAGAGTRGMRIKGRVRASVVRPPKAARVRRSRRARPRGRKRS